VSPPSARDWLTVGEASRVLGVHPDTLRRWADAGDVPVFVTPGKQRRFPRGAIDGLANRAAAVDPTERLVLEYCRSADAVTRERLLRAAERHGVDLGRDAAARDRPLGLVVAGVVAVRRRAIHAERTSGTELVRDANRVVDRILIGLAASRRLRESA